MSNRDLEQPYLRPLSDAPVTEMPPALIPSRFELICTGVVIP